MSKTTKIQITIDLTLPKSDRSGEDLANEIAAYLKRGLMNYCHITKTAVKVTEIKDEKCPR